MLTINSEIEAYTLCYSFQFIHSFLPPYLLRQTAKILHKTMDSGGWPHWSEVAVCTVLQKWINVWLQPSSLWVLAMQTRAWVKRRRRKFGFNLHLSLREWLRAPWKDCPQSGWLLAARGTHSGENLHAPPLHRTQSGLSTGWPAVSVGGCGLGLLCGPSRQGWTGLGLC